MFDPYNPPKREQKPFTIIDWTSAIIGFSIAIIVFQFYSFGFIPAFLIAMLFFTLTRVVINYFYKK